MSCADSTAATRSPGGRGGGGALPSRARLQRAPLIFDREALRASARFAELAVIFRANVLITSFRHLSHVPALTSTWPVPHLHRSQKARNVIRKEKFIQSIRHPYVTLPGLAALNLPLRRLRPQISQKTHTAITYRKEAPFSSQTTSIRMDA